MSEEELAALLSDTSDEWQLNAENRYDEIMKYIVVWLALQDFNPSVDFTSVVTEAYRRAGAGDIDLQSRLDLIRERYPDAQLSPQAVEHLRTSVDLAATQLQATVRQSMMRARLAGASAEDVQLAVEAEIVKALPNVTRALTEAQTMADRTILEGMGAPYYVYEGPADAKNRPFCSQIVRQLVVYTPHGVNLLNSHPLLDSYVPPNVSILCGGFNCRHLWFPRFDVPEGWGVEGEVASGR